MSSHTDKHKGEVAALTVGNFDGVHRGHQQLITSINDFKRQQQQSSSSSGTALKCRSVVITFEPHPVEVLKAGTYVERLCTQNEKIQLLQRSGVDEVKIIPFDKKFSQTSAKEFFEKVLVGDLHVAFLAVGHNFHFGRNREGSPGMIVDWCLERGISAKLIEAVESDGEKISSSLIRSLIAEGNMVKAARMLGRDYSLTGEVIHGDKRGRQLGFPTANLRPQLTGIGTRCLPARGVYLTTSSVGGKSFASVSNVGVKPTVSKKAELVVESHLLDFDGDLYGQQITVEFKDKIRDEKKFDSLEALKQQISKDSKEARSRLL